MNSLPSATTLALRKPTTPSTTPSSSAQGAKPKAEASNNEQEEWMDVVHTRRTECNTNFAYKTNLGLTRFPPDRPDIFEKHLAATGNPQTRVEIQPNQAYKIRVAAVNSLGIGPWSEVLTYRANKPGFLGAPTNVKITKTVDGVLLCWDPPLTVEDGGVIDEYVVYLATEHTGETSSLGGFDHIYSGMNRSCVVSHEQLSKARIDRVSQPCIIFRISVRSGELMSTMQVRWLQTSRDSDLSKGNARSTPSLPSSSSATKTIPKIIRL